MTLKWLTFEDILPFSALLRLRELGFDFAVRDKEILVVIKYSNRVVAAFPDLNECDRDVEEWFDEYVMELRPISVPDQDREESYFSELIVQHIDTIAALFLKEDDSKSRVH